MVDYAWSSGERHGHDQLRWCRSRQSPARITIDLSKTAVLVIDMQNDFGAIGGMFDLAGFDLAPIQDGRGSNGAGYRRSTDGGVSELSMSMKPFAPICQTLPSVESPHRRMSQRMGFGNTVHGPKR